MTKRIVFLNNIIIYINGSLIMFNYKFVKTFTALLLLLIALIAKEGSLPNFRVL